MKFTAVGRSDVSLMFPPQVGPEETRLACLIESDEGDGYRTRRYGELRTASDGTMTFIQEGASQLWAPRLSGGEEGNEA